MTPRQMVAIVLHLLVASVLIYLGRIDEALIHLEIEAVLLIVFRYIKQVSKTVM